MDKETEKILRHDSIAEVEKELGGKHYSEFNELENLYMLSKGFQDNQRKEEYLKSINDTYFNIRWQEFKNLIKQHGFKEGLSYDFKYEDNIEEAIIYYQPLKGLILWATSFWNKKSINGGTMYGYTKVNKEDLEEYWNIFNGCSNKDYWTDEGQYKIEELALIIDKVAKILSKEELEKFYRGIDEGMLYSIMDLMSYHIKRKCK